MTAERQATRLGPLPLDWSVVLLGSVLRRVGEPVTVSASELYREIGIRSHGKGIFHKEPVTGESLGNKRVFSIVPDSLVFNIVFAWEGAVAVTSQEEMGMIGSHRFPMFRPCEPQAVDVEFLRRFFQTKLGIQLLGDASPGGAGRNRTLSQKATAATPIPLPPLPEQRKIAAILSSVDEAIECTKAVIDQLQVVKKAMMADLLTRGIPGRHKTFKQTEIGEVPEDWDIVPLEALAERICVGIVVKPASYYTATGVLCLRGKNVKEDRLVLDDVVFISKESNVLLGKSMLRAGDVVTVRTGEPGTSCVIPDALDGANCIDIIITTPGSRIDSHFLSRFLNSAEGRAVVATGKGGLAQQHFNVGAMKEMPVPVPDRKEQQAIVAALSAIDGRLTQETGAIEGLRQLKSALMSVLLTGEVRVCVDEEDAA